jgi:hypothetical protein
MRDCFDGEGGEALERRLQSYSTTPFPYDPEILSCLARNRAIMEVCLSNPTVDARASARYRSADANGQEAHSARSEP